MPALLSLFVRIKAIADAFAAKPWRFEMGQGRIDTGYVTLQTEIPAFTRVRDHDVLVVTDEGDEFGAHLEGRTARPRPVAGTHGLVATGWSPVTEAWGAMQLQNRFLSLAGRRMTARDYAAWLAVPAVGQAAIRARTSDPAAIAARMRDPDFLLAGSKGQGLSFRDWDGQMRQPVLIAGTAAAGFSLATARLPASGNAAWHAWLRSAGKRVQAAMRTLLLLALLLAAAMAWAETVYVSNEQDDTVANIDGDALHLLETIHVGRRPRGLALSPAGP